MTHLRTCNSCRTPTTCLNNRTCSAQGGIRLVDLQTGMGAGSGQALSRPGTSSLSTTPRRDFDDIVEVLSSRGSDNHDTNHCHSGFGASETHQATHTTESNTCEGNCGGGVSSE